MLKDKLLQFKQNNPILFDKDSHTYNHKTLGKFEGVTGWLKKYTPHFDREGISKGAAFKRGISQEDVLDEWAEAMHYGNRVHDGMELLVNTGEITPEVEPELNAITTALNDYGIEILFSEFTVYNESILRASQVDMLGLHKEKLVVGDYKTNEKGVSFTAYRNEAFLYPLRHIPNTKYDVYSFQISTYQIFLEDHGFPVADEGYIYHIRGNKCTPYLARDYRREVRQLINFDLKTL